MSDKKINERQRKIYKEIQKKQKEVVRHIDVVEHAKIVRKEIKKEFPGIKFRVVSSRFAGGSSVTVYHIGDINKNQRKEIEKFVRKFDGYEGDLMDCRYNVGFLYKGERIAGASFCSYNYKWFG